MFLSIVPRDASTPIPPSVPSLTSANQTCGFIGDNDIYGIGIRIGIYAQMLAVWFANYFLLSEVQVLRDTVSIFSVAILIVTILYAARPSSVHAVEVFILLQILAWSCIMGVRAKSSYTHVNLRSSLVRKAINDVIYLASLCLHVWFWWGGVDRMVKTPCGTFLMYIVKTDMFGWARRLMMGFSVFVLCITVYCVVVEAVRPWSFLRMRRVREEFARAVTTWEDKRSCEPGRNDSLGMGIEGLEETEVSHEGCSQYSCSRCSPTRCEFGLDREATLFDPVSPVAASAEDAQRSPRSSHYMTPPTTPASAHMSPRSVSSNNTKNLLSHPDFAILRHVYESEIYIQHCLSASPYVKQNDGKPLNLLSIIRSILSSGKYQMSIEKHTSKDKVHPPTWLQCHLRIWKLIFTFRFPHQSFIIYSHLVKSGHLGPLSGPFRIYASLTYHDPSTSSSLPAWQHVSLACSLLLAHPSTPTKTQFAWYYALVDFCVHVLVITQLELTLVWNRVEGMTGLWSSVGQLIPFLVGVGGLSLVGGRWVAKMWAKKTKRAGNSSWEGEENEGRREQSERDGCGIELEVREGWARWKEVVDEVDRKTVHEEV